MKLEAVTKIVIYKKYFFTVDSVKIDEDNYDRIVQICDEQRYSFLNKIMNVDFIPLNIEEAGIRTINKRIIDEIKVEVYKSGNRISLHDLENLLLKK